MEKVSDFIKRYAQTVTEAYLFFMIVIFPFYAPQGYVEIGTHKFLFFKVASLMCFGMLLPAVVFQLVCIKRKGWIKLSITDICLLLYGAAVLVSFVCTEWKQDALWGAEGWYMGAASQLLFVAVYFVVSRFIENVKVWYVIGTGISAAVFLLGLLNRFSVYPLQMEGANPGFISTLGNINWFCSYWVVLFPVGLVAYWNGWGNNNRIKKATLIGYMLLGFMTGIAQGSSSGFLALGGLGFAMFILSFKNSEKILRWLELVILFSVSALLLSILKNRFPVYFNYQNAVGDILTQYKTGVFLFAVSVICYAMLHFGIRQKKLRGTGLFVIRNAVMVVTALTVLCICLLTVYYSSHPNSMENSQMAEKFVIDSDWGNGRGTTWYAGIESFASMPLVRKLIGIGPDCFYRYVYEDSEIAAKLYEVFGDARLTNAHNEWLTILVNTGIFGLVAYVATFISSIGRQLKGGRKNEIMLIGAVCQIAYTIHNMVSFQQVICTPLIFIIMGLGERLLHSENSIKIE